MMQDDCLVPTATPREALTFAAILRLPFHTFDTKAITIMVSNTIEELGIEQCADTMIGDDLINGISGGERKRTSVGIELITSPSLLFLDEPISGLDSYNGYKLITLLKRIASSNACVLLTIHQPSSEIFYLFDTVIFLKEGHVLYQGPAEDVVPYFTSRGYMFPPNHNPADTVMFFCEIDSLDTLQERKVLMHPPSLDDNSSANHLDIINISGTGTSPTTSSTGMAVGKSSSLQVDHCQSEAAAWLTQVFQLAQRGAQSTLRNRPALISRFGVVAVINLVTALIFLQAGNQDDSQVENFNAHYGVVTLIMISAMFNSAMPALMEVPSERAVFSREYVAGTYSITAYSSAKLLIDIPLALVQAILQTLIVYYIVQLQGNIGLIILTIWITSLTSSALSVFLGCLVVNSKQAIELAPIVFPPQILFAGFFIATSLIPIWLRWLQWLCPLKYGISLFLLNEFAPFRTSCEGDAAKFCSAILENNGVELSDWWIYTLALIALLALEFDYFEHT